MNSYIVFNIYLFLKIAETSLFTFRYFGAIFYYFEPLWNSNNSESVIEAWRSVRKPSRFHGVNTLSLTSFHGKLLMAKFLAVLRLLVYVQYTCKKQKITRLGSISTLSSKWTRQQICKEIWKLAGPNIFIFIFSIFGHLTIWYTSIPCSPLLAATSACTGPQMIPDRKWSPNWTGNDPDQKNKEWHGWWNGSDSELAYVNTDVFITAISNNYNGLQVAFFHTFD